MLVNAAKGLSSTMTRLWCKDEDLRSLIFLTNPLLPYMTLKVKKGYTSLYMRIYTFFSVWQESAQIEPPRHRREEL